MTLDLTAIGRMIGPFAKEYTWRDAILYALGVGAGFDELEFCYEKDLKIIPSFAVIALDEYMVTAIASSRVNQDGSFHGEQEFIFHSPIPSHGGTITTEGQISHMYDMGAGKGALIVAESVSRYSNGEKLFTSISTVFSRSDGGFGGEYPPRQAVMFPDRPPDFPVPDCPTVDQPLIYRLSGDYTTLHADPEVARGRGFEMPIMAGLCTLGFAARGVIKCLCPGEPERLKRLRNRFSNTLYPGEPIETQIWKLGEGKAVFKTINVKTQRVTIDHGIAELVC